MSTPEANVISGSVAQKGSLGPTNLVESGVGERDLFLHPGFRFNPQEHLVMFNDLTEVALTDSETRILKYFMQNANRVLGYRETKLNVNGSEYFTDNWFRVHVGHLRRKLKDDGNETPRIVETCRGRGYRFNNPTFAEKPTTHIHNPLFDFNPESGEIMVDSKKIRLTQKENELLTALHNNVNTFVSSFTLRTIVGGNYYCSSASLAVHIGHLRGKIIAGRPVKSPIENVYKKGYRLVDESLAA